MSQERLGTFFSTKEEIACFFYGVGHAGEGICLVVQMGKYRIMLDCGLSDISPLLASDEPPADLVLCSHAHSDHAQGLLSLHRAFPKLPIYASDVTTQLLPLNWLASPTEEIPAFCHALPWRSPIEFQDGLCAELFPAGHLPGAAAIVLSYTTANRTYSLLYTGDFFLSNSRLVEGLHIDPLRGLQPDVLIVEGTYGTSRHPHRRQQENQLMERIDRAIQQGSSPILPVPAIGLGQELAMLLRSHHLFTGRNLDIWVEESVALGCDAYLELLPSFPASVQNFARHQSLFWDERIRPRLRRITPERFAEIGEVPSIIISDRLPNLHRYSHLSRDACVVLLPQQSKIAANPKLARNLHTETYLLAEHSDGIGTTQLIHNIRPKHAIFLHGSPTYLADLTGLEELQNRYHLHLPSAGSLVELPIGETFVQPAPPVEANYEGELTELETLVSINLPNLISSDPRWQKFADTGLIEARWQGEELVLRGLSQKELLNQDRFRVAPEVQCCGNCLHMRGQRCWNPNSALYGFKVTPDGNCPVFERFDR
jgi:Cft2 family RNA processing exonuclease